MEYDETVCMAALNSVLGYDPVTASRLLSSAGGAGELFRKPPLPFAMKLTPGILEKTAGSLEAIGKAGIRFIPSSSADYPPLLKECPDYPVGIYYKGISPPSEVFREDRRAVAIIGTRSPSPYGRKYCRDIVSKLSHTKEKPLIVSGLAYGIDYIAHSSALEMGLTTVAVNATGLDSVYPFRHAALAERIASTPGCALVSDYPPGTAPLPANFLRRNRIIAGLCQASILIESKVKGGGLVTIRYANEYDRSAFALPGRIDDICSIGCNNLISKNMAEIITSPGDLVQRLGLSPSEAGDGDRMEEASRLVGGMFPPEEASIILQMLEHIRKEDGILAETLSGRCGYGMGRISAWITALETLGLVKCDLAGRCFVR